MNRIAIRTQRIGKVYRLGHVGERNDTLRDTLVDAFRRTCSPKSAEPDSFWALRDVSFEIQQGEAIGIIGRNGAGKSTLLKILSRITEPTEGRAEIHGRVGSLLEVGTGFHPELTGRENIYLNGAILGMRRVEIERKFEEIVAFAEVERFLNTPVKRYSSGMYVRLAFAVAAHLEPEVLLVDEVLAVGDLAFQKRCLGKMEDVARQGRTVMFVSHNIPSVQHLCNRALLLADGCIVKQGMTADVIAEYMSVLSQQAGTGSSDLATHPGRRPGSTCIMQCITLKSETQVATTFTMGASWQVEVSLSFPYLIKDPNLRLAIENQYGQLVIAYTTALQSPGVISSSIGNKVVNCSVPLLLLLSGIYYITLIVSDGNRDLDWIDRAVRFEVQSADVFGTGRAPLPEHGVFYQNAKWTVTG